MRSHLTASNLTQEEVHELHSLSRYPPMGLRPLIDGAFVWDGAATCKRIPEINGQSGRYHLTDKGKEWLYATADRCTINHCPCKDRSRETADVTDKKIDERLRNLGRPV